VAHFKALNNGTNILYFRGNTVPGSKEITTPLTSNGSVFHCCSDTYLQVRVGIFSAVTSSALICFDDTC